MKLILTESQILKVLNEEYSQKVMNQLVDKFKQEDPQEDEKLIRDYISRFDKIKGNAKVTDKDLFNYSLHDLRITLMSFYNTTDFKPKSYKGDSDLDLVYDTNNIKIYRSDTREKCIAYGNGYSFCISSYSDTASYNKYRIKEVGTPYFIFNKNLDSTRIDRYNYIDPDHLLVLFVHVIGGEYFDNSGNLHRRNLKDYEDFEDRKTYPDENSMVENIDKYYYSITDARNNGEQYYISFNSIAKNYPFLNGLENIFEPVDLHGKDIEAVKFEQESNKRFMNLRKKYSKYMNGRFGLGFRDSCDTELLSLNRIDDFNFSSAKNVFVAAGKNEFYGYKAIRNDDGRAVCYHYGRKGYDECAEEVKNEIIDFGGSRDKTDYEIVKCDWPEGYADYIKDAHRLGTYLLHKKWSIYKD